MCPEIVPFVLILSEGNGRITESWDIEDELTLLRQIGVNFVQARQD